MTQDGICPFWRQPPSLKGNSNHPGAILRAFLASVVSLARKTSLAALAGLSVAGLLASAAPGLANSKYAGIVVDANTGKTLYESSADSLRYPASLTKMMTLYIAFEALKAGKVSKSTRIPVSAYAAGRPPSKLGLRAGQTISLESAIYALVTKSANDVASALGEYFGGSEAGFAKIMTAKARALGMSRTVFRNPHGLPDARQVTTARDMARLGIALREHFPQYYSYFSTRVFTYGKRRYRNHNRLLGKVRGVDGIKTGYTRASGFNLVSSVRSGKRSIVAVVMGGRTGASRNAQMKKLIAAYLPKASTRDRGNLVARGKAAPVQVAGIPPLPRTDIPVPSSKPVSVATTTSVASASSTPLVDPVKTAAVPPATGWVVQVASMPSRDEAVQFFDRIKGKAGAVLASAEGFTTTFEKDGTLYYRARFGGFAGKDAAWKACSSLKRRKISCYATEQ